MNDVTPLERAAAIFLTRTMLGFVYLFAGVHKLLDPGVLEFGRRWAVSQASQLLPGALLMAVGTLTPCIELVLGGLLLMGLWTRPVLRWPRRPHRGYRCGVRRRRIDAAEGTHRDGHHGRELLHPAASCAGNAEPLPLGRGRPILNRWAHEKPGLIRDHESLSRHDRIARLFDGLGDRLRRGSPGRTATSTNDVTRPASC